jgi:protein-L-isoaspartate(D-aspartate) O-methyltransferase
MATNTETARAQMVNQQVRAWDVLDARVLNVMRTVPRERYVPAAYRDVAFADAETPIGHGEYLMRPQVEGRLLQSLQIESIDEVLEIGTGTGFLTACLAALGARVHSIDIHEDFIAAARDRLDADRVVNATVAMQDANTLTPDAQYDVVAVTASVPTLPKRLTDLLRPGGRMFVVVGHSPLMEAQLVSRQVDGGLTTAVLFETVLAPMRNWQDTEVFEL